MKHAISQKKLGREIGPRKHLIRNLVSELLKNDRITTTLAKAKTIRPIVEKIITTAKTDNFNNRRNVAKFITNNRVLVRLFNDVAPRYTERAGGYTRIVKIGLRRGDGIEQAVIELLDTE